MELPMKRSTLRKLALWLGLTLLGIGGLYRSSAAFSSDLRPLSLPMLEELQKDLFRPELNGIDSESTGRSIAPAWTLPQTGDLEEQPQSDPKLEPLIGITPTSGKCEN